MLVLGGVFERHPDLKVVCVEADAGWVPHFMYRHGPRLQAPPQLAARGPGAVEAAERVLRREHLHDVPGRLGRVPARRPDELAPPDVGQRLPAQRLDLAVDAGDARRARRRPQRRAARAILCDNVAELYGIDITTLAAGSSSSRRRGRRASRRQPRTFPLARAHDQVAVRQAGRVFSAWSRPTNGSASPCHQRTGVDTSSRRKPHSRPTSTMSFGIAWNCSRVADAQVLDEHLADTPPREPAVASALRARTPRRTGSASGFDTLRKPWSVVPNGTRTIEDAVEPVGERHHAGGRGVVARGRDAEAAEHPFTT